MKKLILLTIFPLFFGAANGQHLNADSLIKLALAVKDSSVNTLPVNPDSLLNKLFAMQSPAERIRAVYNIILLDNGELNVDRALYYHNKILEEAKKHNDLIIQAVIMSELGYTITQNGDGPTGIKMILQALDIAEKTGNYQAIGVVYDNLGICYQGSAENKIAYFKKAYQYSMAGQDHLFAYAALKNIGSTFYNINIDSSRYYYLQSFSLAVQKKSEWVARVLLQLATFEKGPAVKLKYYRAALQMQLTGRDAGMRSDVFDQMAAVFDQQGTTDSALFYALSAYRLTQNLFISRRIGPAKVLGDVYKMHNADSALKYTEIYYALKDSMYNINKAEQAQSLAFAEQQHQQEIATQKAGYRTAIKLYMLMAAIVFLLVWAFIFWRNNRRKQKANNILSEQKEEISAQRDELENKNRELAVEAALERVRAVAMSMSKPGDLINISQAVYRELSSLGFGNLRNTFIDAFNDEEKYFDDYDYSDFTKGNISRIPFGGQTVLKKYLDKVRGKNDSFFEVAITGQELEDWKAFRASNNEVYDARLDQYDTLYYFVYPAGDASLGISTFNPVDAEKLAVLNRFRNIFGLAYKRYVDITNAEAQAKEAKIEAALERVRSRSMGMQKSYELKEVIQVVYEQMANLDINVEHAGFVVDYKPKDDWHFWIADNIGSPAKITVTYFESTWGNVFDETKEKGINLFTTKLDFEEKNKFYTDMFAHTQAIPVEEKEIIFSKPGLAASTVVLADIALYIENFSGTPYTKDENATLMRFGNVFQQAYTRFLDLQKAEAQVLRAEQDLAEIKAARKKAEDALTELQATQKQLIQSEKMASLGELTAGIAHEIQNPLNFVNNFSDVSRELLDEMKEALEKDDKEEAKEIANDIIANLEKINHHGKRADAIVKGMLQHSRKSTGQKEPTDINALCDEYLRLSYHGLRAKDKSFNANIETHFDEGVGKMNIVPQDIGRVLLNLFNNAFYAVSQKKKIAGADYSPQVSAITTSGTGYIIIKVKDNGMGIPEAIKDKIMQPFFTTKPTGEGTGLGLSLSNDIVVKGHQGSIFVDSEQGKGSEFIVQLPVS